MRPQITASRASSLERQARTAYVEKGPGRNLLLGDLKYLALLCGDLCALDRHATHLFGNEAFDIIVNNVIVTPTT